MAARRGERPSEPGPERTCIACRSTERRDALVRLVLDPDGRVIVDLRAKLPGRGAWVHASRDCLRSLDTDPQRASRALTKGAKGAARSPSGGGDLERQLEEGLVRSIMDALSLAAAAGVLVSGHDALENAIAAGRIEELVVAADASARTVRDLSPEQPPFEITRLPVDRSSLGAKLGLEARAAVGLLRSPAFQHLRTQLRLLRSMG